MASGIRRGCSLYVEDGAGSRRVPGDVQDGTGRGSADAVRVEGEQLTSAGTVIVADSGPVCQHEEDDLRASREAQPVEVAPEDLRRSFRHAPIHAPEHADRIVA